eukprot:TRINITY_DN49182_c0_g1_i1.p1 TRINITY_DN49182_c0_g1~~TRINITY_DN49182_c0_g1_i1.p1  ORF type:complete len:317 (+),score=64.55 TRINITY_DN49182_c0_g1_i1:41-991(+)
MASGHIDQWDVPLEVAEHVPVPCEQFSPFNGPVFNHYFTVSVCVRDVHDKVHTTNFVKALIASMKGIDNPFPFMTKEQLEKMSQLSKILDRFDDKGNHGGERANAFRLLQAKLADMNLNMNDLRTVHESADPGLDADAKTEIHVCKNSNHYHGGWKKSRDWFENLADTICQPLGLQKGQSTWGKVCVQGVAFVGTLATALAAGVVVAKIADAALTANYKCKTLEDDFCAGFCRELLEGHEYLKDTQQSDYAEKMRRMTKELRDEFGWEGGHALSPKSSDRTSASALDGRSSAEKRRRDFEEPIDRLSKYKVLKLEF